MLPLRWTSSYHEKYMKIKNELTSSSLPAVDVVLSTSSSSTTHFSSSSTTTSSTTFGGGTVEQEEEETTSKLQQQQQQQQQKSNQHGGNGDEVELVLHYTTTASSTTTEGSRSFSGMYDASASEASSSSTSSSNSEEEEEEFDEDNNDDSSDDEEEEEKEFEEEEADNNDDDASVISIFDSSNLLPSPTAEEEIEIVFFDSSSTTKQESDEGGQKRNKQQLLQDDGIADFPSDEASSMMTMTLMTTDKDSNNNNNCAVDEEEEEGDLDTIFYNHPPLNYDQQKQEAKRKSRFMVYMLQQQQQKLVEAEHMKSKTVDEEGTTTTSTTITSTTDEEITLEEGDEESEDEIYFTTASSSDDFDDDDDVDEEDYFPGNRNDDNNSKSHNNDDNDEGYNNQKHKQSSSSSYYFHFDGQEDHHHHNNNNNNNCHDVDTPCINNIKTKNNNCHDVDTPCINNTKKKNFEEGKELTDHSRKSLFFDDLLDGLFDDDDDDDSFKKRAKEEEEEENFITFSSNSSFGSNNDHHDNRNGIDVTPNPSSNNDNINENIDKKSSSSSSSCSEDLIAFSKSDSLPHNSSSDTKEDEENNSRSSRDLITFSNSSCSYHHSSDSDDKSKMNLLGTKFFSFSSNDININKNEEKSGIHSKKEDLVAFSKSSFDNIHDDNEEENLDDYLTSFTKSLSISTYSNNNCNSNDNQKKDLINFSLSSDLTYEEMGGGKYERTPATDISNNHPVTKQRQQGDEKSCTTPPPRNEGDKSQKYACIEKLLKDHKDSTIDMLLNMMQQELSDFDIQDNVVKQKNKSTTSQCTDDDDSTLWDLTRSGTITRTADDESTLWNLTNYIQCTSPKSSTSSSKDAPAKNSDISNNEEAEKFQSNGCSDDDDECLDSIFDGLVDNLKQQKEEKSIVENNNNNNNNNSTISCNKSEESSCSSHGNTYLINLIKNTTKSKSKCCNDRMKISSKAMPAAIDPTPVLRSSNMNPIIRSTLPLPREISTTFGNGEKKDIWFTGNEDESQIQDSLDKIYDGVFLNETTTTISSSISWDRTTLPSLRLEEHQRQEQNDNHYSPILSTPTVSNSTRHNRKDPPTRSEACDENILDIPSSVEHGKSDSSHPLNKNKKMDPPTCQAWTLANASNPIDSSRDPPPCQTPCHKTAPTVDHGSKCHESVPDEPLPDTSELPCIHPGVITDEGSAGKSKVHASLRLNFASKRGYNLDPIFSMIGSDSAISTSRTQDSQDSIHVSPNNQACANALDGESNEDLFLVRSDLSVVADPFESPWNSPLSPKFEEEFSRDFAFTSEGRNFPRENQSHSEMNTQDMYFDSMGEVRDEALGFVQGGESQNSLLEAARFDQRIIASRLSSTESSPQKTAGILEPKIETETETSHSRRRRRRFACLNPTIVQKRHYPKSARKTIKDKKSEEKETNAKPSIREQPGGKDADQNTTDRLKAFDIHGSETVGASCGSNNPESIATWEYDEKDSGWHTNLKDGNLATSSQLESTTPMLAVNSVSSEEASGRTTPTIKTDPQKRIQLVKQARSVNKRATSGKTQSTRHQAECLAASYPNVSCIPVAEHFLNNSTCPNDGGIPVEVDAGQRNPMVLFRHAIDLTKRHGSIRPRTCVPSENSGIDHTASCKNNSEDTVASSHQRPKQIDHSASCKKNSEDTVASSHQRPKQIDLTAPCKKDSEDMGAASHQRLKQKSGNFFKHAKKGSKLYKYKQAKKSARSDKSNKGNGVSSKKKGRHQTASSDKDSKQTFDNAARQGTDLKQNVDNTFLTAIPNLSSPAPIQNCNDNKSKHRRFGKETTGTSKEKSNRSNRSSFNLSTPKAPVSPIHGGTSDGANLTKQPKEQICRFNGSSFNSSTPKASSSPIRRGPSCGATMTMQLKEKTPRSNNSSSKWSATKVESPVRGGISDGAKTTKKPKEKSFRSNDSSLKMTMQLKERTPRSNNSSSKWSATNVESPVRGGISDGAKTTKQPKEKSFRSNDSSLKWPATKTTSPIREGTSDRANLTNKPSIESNQGTSRIQLVKAKLQEAMKQPKPNTSSIVGDERQYGTRRTSPSKKKGSTTSRSAWI